MRKLTTTLLITLLSGIAFTAQAQSTPNLDKREANQERRIDQGIDSGALTQREANRMEQREVKLEQHEAAAKADGVVTRRERVKLQAEAHRDSKAIHRQKHDRQHDYNHNGVVDHRHR